MVLSLTAVSVGAVGVVRTTALIVAVAESDVTAEAVIAPFLLL